MITEPAVNLAAIKGAVRTILRAVAEDPDRDGLLETPRRVANMYAKMFTQHIGMKHCRTNAKIWTAIDMVCDVTSKQCVQSKLKH